MNFIEIENNLINLDLVCKIEFDDKHNTIDFIFTNGLHYWNFGNTDAYEYEKQELIDRLKIN